MAESIFKKMLTHRQYLYRPWIPFLKSVEAAYISKITIPKQSLDIGCGDGISAKYTFNTEFFCGLDISRDSLNYAKGLNFYDSLIEADASKLPFKDESFKRVLTVCVLEHFQNLEVPLLEITRILRKGGSLIFTVPSIYFGDMLFGSRLYGFSGLRKMADRYGKRKNKKSIHINVFSQELWVKKLKDCGLTVYSVKPILDSRTVFLWGFFSSMFFKLALLPFRILREFNIAIIDTVLRNVLLILLEKHTFRQESNDKGGYLLITAKKDENRNC